MVKFPTNKEIKEKLEFMDMYDELWYITELEKQVKSLKLKITKLNKKYEVN